MTIKVEILADSISPEGVRLTTFVLEYPRYIHAEVMTHRVFSRNAQSSRAVPVAKSLIQEILSPVVWGQNKAGMSSSEELDEQARKECAYFWHAAARACQDFSERMSKLGLHKQWANRPLEWFSPIKVIITATEWDNFFWLRDDLDAAQPEIVELARKMKYEMDGSKPLHLNSSQWHLPYVNINISNAGMGQELTVYSLEDGTQLTLDEAKYYSAAKCAAVSYRTEAMTLEKAKEIWEKLFSGPKPHLSPVEHIATPMMGRQVKDGYPINHAEDTHTWEEGITHVTRDGSLYSGNLRGFVQLRQLI